MSFGDGKRRDQTSLTLALSHPATRAEAYAEELRNKEWSFEDVCNPESGLTLKSLCISFFIFISIFISCPFMRRVESRALKVYKFMTEGREAMILS